MIITELNRDQLDELKSHYVTEMAKLEGRSPSYGELSEASETVSDDFLYKLYADVTFSLDDFWCTAGGC